MSLAFDLGASIDRAVVVLRAGVLARDICRRGRRAEIAAVFERSFYLRGGDDFICIGEPGIGNGPTTLIIAARVAELGLQRGQPALVSNESITVGDVLFELRNCATWRALPWPALPSPAALRANCDTLARRAATESPPDSLARATFGTNETPLTRWARPLRGLSPPYGAVRDLIGLGPGLTPSGDDFLIGALAALDALGQTNMHAVLGRAVIAVADRTSPLSASFLRAAAAGHVGENLHTMIAAVITGDADAAIAQARRIGHTSGWDALAGAAVTAGSSYRC